MKNLIGQAIAQVIPENPAGMIAFGTGTSVSVWSINEFIAIGGTVVSSLTVILFGINTWLRYRELAHAKATGKDK